MAHALVRAVSTLVSRLGTAPSFPRVSPHAFAAVGLLTLSLLLPLSAQQPPQLAAVWNSASFLPEVSAGAFASASGANLASQTCEAKTLPRPRTLCGVRVTADAEDLPLLYVSPGQVNFQLSYQTGPRRIVVTRDNVPGNEVAIQVLPRAPGIFTYSLQCRNLAAAQLGDYSLVGPANALRVPTAGGLALENVLVLYVQGLGAPLDADAAPPGDVYRTALNFRPPDLYLDGVRQPPEQNLYVGSTPGTAIQQINWVPSSNTTAGAHTLRLCTSEACSQEATVFMTRTGRYLAGSVQVVDDGDPAAVRARAAGRPLAIDRNGNFLADAEGDVTLEVLGVPALYNWRKNFAVNGPTTLDGPVQLFRIVTDTANRFDFHRDIAPDWNTRLPEMVTWTAGDAPLDLLDYLYWSYGSFWCASGALTRLPDAVLPKTLFVPPDAGAPPHWRESIAAAAAAINAASGKPVYTLLDRSANPGEAGYSLRLSAIGGAVFRASGAGGCGSSFDILSATILFDPDDAAFGRDPFTGTVAHELHHGLGLWPHARPPAYLMHYIQNGNDALTALEIRADRIAFAFRPATDLRLYDKRPD